jgi:DNA-binding NarL/FixJ family response regulator
MINILIYEDDRRYWETLQMLLNIPDEMDVAYISENCMNCVADVKTHKPDVVIMDINLPKKNGIEAVSELKKIWPELKIVMFTVYEDNENVFNAIKAGAIGYILKYEAAKIALAVKEVYEGKAFINGYIAGKIMNYFQSQHSQPIPNQENLTTRENEILKLLNNGLTYKEIADQCSISPQTLNSHIKNIYTKLNVHSRAEIAARFRNQE